MKKKNILMLAALAWFMAQSVARAQDAGQGSPTPQERPQASKPAPSQPMKIRIPEGIVEGGLIHRATPVYPEEAKASGIEGTVVLHAIIATDGTVKDLQFVSGPPVLIAAAMDAVKQWKYQPFLVDGKPVEVETDISVVFAMSSDSGAQPAQSTEAAGGSASQTESVPAVDPQLRADILQLRNTTHAVERDKMAMRKTFDSLRPQVVALLPDTPNREKIASAFEDKVVSLTDTPEFNDGMVRIYAQYFSDDDVKAMIAFYQTPAGQRVNEHGGDLMTDMMAFGQRLVGGNTPRILGEMCKQFPELEGKTNFCPAPEEKKSQLILPLAQPGSFE